MIEATYTEQGISWRRMVLTADETGGELDGKPCREMRD